MFVAVEAARLASRKSIAAALSGMLLVLSIAGPAFADTLGLSGSNSGQASTATVVCEFNSATNTFTFTATNTSAITMPGSTATITAIGYDLPPTGNASASGLNGFTGVQAPSLSANFSFSDADVGSVPIFAGAVIDFAFLTGSSGNFSGGDVNDGLLPGESASFTVSGAAFAGFTETAICNAVYVRFANVPVVGSDVAANSGSYQPDARIKRAGSNQRGNDVYNTTGQGQAVTMTTFPGHRRVYLTIQNDGDAADTFSLDVTGTSPAGYVLHYFRNRSQHELTAEIEAGTFVTPTLAPGQVYRIRVRIETTTDAVHGSQLTRLFTFSSEHDGNAQDAALLTVTRH